MDEETRWSAFLVARQLCNSNLSIQPFSVLLSSSLFIYSYLILTLLTKPVQGSGAEAVNLCHGECGPWGSIIAPILKASTLPLVGLLARYQEPSFWRYGCNQELPAPPNTYPQGSLSSPRCRTLYWSWLRSYQFHQIRTLSHFMYQLPRPLPYVQTSLARFKIQIHKLY